MQNVEKNRLTLQICWQSLTNNIGAEKISIFLIFMSSADKSLPTKRWILMHKMAQVIYLGSSDILEQKKIKLDRELGVWIVSSAVTRIFFHVAGMNELSLTTKHRQQPSVGNNHVFNSRICLLSTWCLGESSNPYDRNRNPGRSIWLRYRSISQTYS